jgi:hypothetical protein
MPSYSPSVVPDITETIPSVISARSMAATFANTGARYNLSVAGLPFFLAISEQRPYQRESADIRRQQFDTSKEAGEQSLDQSLWTRSQPSWHLGAGITYYEPGADDGTEFRYSTSSGVDVWTVGQATLLHSMTKPTSSAGVSYVAGAVVGGTDVFFANNNGTVSRSDGTTVTPFTGTTSATSKPVVAGSTLVVGVSNQMWKGTASGSVLASMAFTGVVGNMTPYYVKGRLFTVNANSLYDLTIASTGALPTAVYTHPDSGWTWTDVTETTDAILASGYSNGYGAIYRFSLQQNGAATLPSLSAGFQIAEFPPGEVPYSIKAYLGKYIGIGTNKGLRVGIITGQTSVSPTVIQYGPVLVSTTSPVIALAARDAYIYAGVTNQIDGSSGAVRVSLQQEVIANSLRFPYAYDANTHVTGTVDGIAFLGSSDRVVLGLDAVGVYQQSATAYETSGYVTSGRIRYATSELKAFRQARVRATFPDALTGITLSTIAPGGAEASIVRIASDSDPDQFIALSRPIGQFEYISVKTTLSGDGTTTPTMVSTLIKALPATRRSRLVQYPLLCQDHESDVNNTKVGTDHWGITRLQALEDLESTQAVVTIHDFDSDESYEGQIEKIAFTRISPANKAGGNFGGFVNLVVRKFAA